MTYIIADVIFNYDQRLLQKGENTRNLEPKVFSLLAALISAKGGIVTREQLTQEVWNNRVVGEGAINRTVSLLRAHFSVLTDIDVIETVPTQGYRLKVTVKDEAKEINRNTTIIKKRDSFLKPATLLTGLLGLALIVAIFIPLLNSTSPSAKRVSSLKLINAPLIALSGLEYRISASQDGTSVLFHHLDKEDHQSVIIYDTGTHKKRKLLTNALAALSPAGNKVAFVNNDERCTFSMLEGDFKQSNELFECEFPPAAIKWSKEEYLYFNQRQSKSHPYQIFSYHLSTQHIQQITNPSSQNNTRGDFQFTVNPETGELAVLRYTNEIETKVTIYKEQSELHTFNINKGLKNIVWHPNNTDLLVSDERRVHQLSVNTGDLNELLQLDSFINSLATIKQNDKASLLVSNSIAKSDIQEFDIKTSKNKVWQQSGGTELLPRMQADRQLVLSTRFKEHKWWQVKEDKTQLVDVSLPFDLKFVRYELSPDGKRLLLTKHGAAYEVDIETGSDKRLFDESNTAYVINYDEQDPNSIIYSTNRTGQWQLWRYHLNNKTHHPLTTKGGYSGRVWNGSLFYSKYSMDGLWRKEFGNEQESLIIEDFDRINWLNWQIRGNNVYFYRPGTGIWQYNLDTEALNIIMETQSHFVHQYTVSPDQEKIYWVQRSSTEGDIHQYGFLAKE